MESTIAKPVVVITHIILSAESLTQYFAIPEADYSKVPTNVTWVSLGDSEKCYLELHPVAKDDTEGIDDFKDDLEVNVDLDHSFLPPWVQYEEIKNWHWFTLLTDQTSK